MAKEDFYTPSIRECWRLRAALAKAAEKVKDLNGGLTDTRCHLICAIAEKAGRTYAELSQRTNIPLPQVKGDCRAMAGYRLGLVRISRKNPKPVQLYLTEKGMERHLQIKANR